MFKKICTVFLLLLFLAISAGTAFSAPLIEIKDYNETVDFTQQKLVYVQPGDNPDYKDPGYDDSAWRLISLPSNWKKLYPKEKDFCWYRMRIKFPENLPEFAPGISLGKISDVDEVFFNGHLIGRTGEFPPNRVPAYDKKRLYEIPMKFIKTGETNVLAIRVGGLFDYESGPYTGDFEIGVFQDMQRAHLAKEFFDSFFIMIYLVVAIYFALLFVRRSINYEYLFFSLFTMSAAIYLFLRTEVKYFLSNDFIMMKRIEYFFLFVVLLFMMEYFTFYFKRRHSLLHYVYLAITVVSSLVVIISDNLVYWSKVLFYIVQPAWLIPISFGIFVSIRESKKGKNSRYILLSFPAIWLIFLNDILVDRMVYDFTRLSHYAFLLVIIGTAIIMRKRFSELSAEVEDFREKSKWKTSITEDSKKKLDEVITYLDENYTSDIAREGIAVALDINPDYLGKLFKNYKGMKIGDYINELRIQKASELLSDGDESVTDIAFAVGYESLSTFYRVFQKIMDESPTNYRDRKKGTTA
ncbi:MAG: helix-turn-helix domain-containing protein [bacterium]|nr:helix-turn-helix domain-containing protein [bacterium]